MFVGGRLEDGYRHVYRLVCIDAPVFVWGRLDDVYGHVYKRPVFVGGRLEESFAIVSLIRNACVLIVSSSAMTQHFSHCGLNP